MSVVYKYLVVFAGLWGLLLLIDYVTELRAQIWRLEGDVREYHQRLYLKASASKKPRKASRRSKVVLP